MFVLVFGLIVLGACWYAGDQTLRTKLVFTVLYVASFGLLLLPDLPFLFLIAQCALIVVIGASTFGLDWLTKQR